MIEVNFLPAKYKRRKIELPNLGKIKIIPIAVCSALIFVLLYALFTTWAAVKMNTLKKLTAGWQSKLSQKEEASQLAVEIRRLKKKADLIDNLIGHRMLWSKKLNQISDLMSDGIWLQNLMLGERKKKKTLIFKGSVVTKDKQETAVIGNFMQNLRGSADFFSDFEEIELESIKRSQIAKTEIMEFTLILFFKETAGTDMDK